MLKCAYTGKSENVIKAIIITVRYIYSTVCAVRSRQMYTPVVFSDAKKTEKPDSVFTDKFLRL